MEPKLSVAVGDELPPLVRRGTAEHWTRFAAVNDEFAAHHWDVEVARHEGFEAPFAMAPLELSFFHTMLRDWIGDAGRIVSVSASLRSPFLLGRTLTSRAVVTSVADGEGIDDGGRAGTTTVELELTQVDDTGTTVSSGTATVELRPG